MDSASRRMWAFGLLGVFVQVVHGVSKTALSATPSTQWYGIDGDWSAITLQLGTPPQEVDVMVSTVSSETWVGASTACQSGSDGFTCSLNRGKLFNQHNSSTWQPYGDWSLTVDAQLGNKGYGEYGLDNVVFGSTGVSVPGAIIAAYNGTGNINETLYQLGFFGLGITPGKFPPHNSPLPAINALVEQVGAFPSHSYGYTAGAKYQGAGTPNSLTLGGFDANRFVNHSIIYPLNPIGNPQVVVNSVTATSKNFSSPVQLLSQSDRVSAVIDSSTPYLWLPPSVCDRFASSFGLVYNNSLNLYTFGGNDSQRSALMNSGLSFTFVITDIQSGPKVVNITLPYDAFNLQLKYPAIPGTSYSDPASSKWYFPLRQAATEAQYTIGRVFLQEAYLITNYETHSFSVHQAVHITDPVGNTSIWTIPAVAGSGLSGEKKKSGSGIATGAVVGIVIGAIAAISLAMFTFWYLRRRKSQKHDHSDDEKPVETQQRSFGLLNRIRGRHTNPHPSVTEVGGSTTYATEVGADASHERFELPAPLGPAELDSESGTLDGSTQNGSTQNSENLSAYESARRKLERQQIAAAHAQAQVDNYPVEKSENDHSHVAHYRAPDTPTSEEPLVSPIGPGGDFGNFGNMSIGSDQPSPVSPGFSSSPVTPITPAPHTGPPPSYRRFNPENVVYAGRLPANVQLPSIVPRIIGPDGRTVRAEETMITQAGGTNSSLGSQYTDIEAGMTDLYGSGDTNIVSPVASGSTGSGSGSTNTNMISPIHSDTSGSGDHRDPHAAGTGSDDSGQSPRTGVHLREGSDPFSSRRRLQGEDLVHVPQPAENRFSWEEERISGNDSL